MSMKEFLGGDNGPIGMSEALRQKDKERDEKIAKGEIVCDIKDPDNCESCSG